MTATTVAAVAAVAAVATLAVAVAVAATPAEVAVEKALAVAVAVVDVEPTSKLKTPPPYRRSVASNRATCPTPSTTRATRAGCQVGATA